jgi:uncharacterized protein (TIGR00661 family)
MRIVYGVHGYGRGHATRALAVLPHLARRHQLLVLAGGDAHAAIAPDFPVMRIPTLGFAYGRKSGQRSNWNTFRRNFPAALDLLLNGPVFGMVRAAIADFAPDAVICDAEAWTQHAAASLKVPRISFDHIGMMAYCRPRIEWRDQLEARFDTLCYQLLMLEPERVIVSSFYPLEPSRRGVRVIGTLARKAVRETIPTTGKHLLVYFNQGHHQLRPRILKALEGVGCPIHVYGTARRGRHGSLSFLPPSNLPFLEDLASCRAVISTAGNQLMGEAAFLGKPMLVMPERCVEQRLNAAAVERLGIGIRTTPSRFNAELVRRFLDNSGSYLANLQQHKRDGLPEALSAIEQFLRELAPRAANCADTTAAPTTTNSVGLEVAS